MVPAGRVELCGRIAVSCGIDQCVHDDRECLLAVKLHGENTPAYKKIRMFYRRQNVLGSTNALIEK